MSKQSERKTRELKKAKAAAKLFNLHQNAPNQRPETNANPEIGKNKAEQTSVTPRNRLIDRPGIMVIVGTVLFGLASFIQLYNHSIAIWILFLALVSCVQLARVEFCKHGNPAEKVNFGCGITVVVALLICCMLQIVEIRKSSAITQSNPTTRSPTQINVIQQQDYIEGTHFTQTQLKQIFPFGYTVFYSDGNERFRYEVFTNGLLDWNMDLDSVKFEPDFSRGIVKLHIPPLSAKGKNGLPWKILNWGMALCNLRRARFLCCQ